MNREIIDTIEITRNYYLLEEDENYKILILHVLRKLNNDIKQEIFDLLVNEEKQLLELEEIRQLINQNWYEFDIDIDILSDLESIDLDID